MVTRIFVGLIALPALLCCSSARVEPLTPQELPPPEFLATPLVPEPPPALNRNAELVLLEQQFEAYLPGWGSPEFRGQVCQVGKACLSMDDRPFRVCLLSAGSCGEQLQESKRRGEHFGLPFPGLAR